jgi:transaldolase/glucose-6-phosphate isomerase
MNPLKQLNDLGQSIWLDNIHREMLISGSLAAMIENDGVRGQTSNPTIFEKAMASGTEYDDSLKDLVAKKKSVEEIFDVLSVADIQSACDIFRPLYDQTKGADGFVSIEVAPNFARDTQGTIREARRLWKLVDRPNCMVKIPATREGVPAIETCLAEGININITLIFSVERYKAVMEAYRRALETRAAAGKSVNVASVASFFVSRIDSVVDKILQEKIQSSSSSKEKDQLLELLGKVAIANAKVAYQSFLKFFAGDWFPPLLAKGARLQRPLWASTGTKNPHYSDVLYIEELIGKNTVNTVPPATLDAFRDHGKPRADAVEEKGLEAFDTMEKLALVKIDFQKVTDQLEAEGVKSFHESFEKLMAGLSAKKAVLEKQLSLK